MEDILERFLLVRERIEQLAKAPEVKAPFGSYVTQVARFWSGLFAAMDQIEKQRVINIPMDGDCKGGGVPRFSEEQGKTLLESLYAPLDPKTYENSYLRPAYACRKLGAESGGILSAYFADLMGLIPLAYEGRREEITVFAELFLLLHLDLRDEDLSPSERAACLSLSIHEFYRDYTDLYVREDVLDLIDPSRDFIRRIVMDSDLSDLSYLYSYGAPIGENERQMAAFLNSRSEEEIERMARTYSEGYRRGFETTGKDISLKSSVKIEYPIGMERMVRCAVEHFEDMGLAVVFVRESGFSYQGRGKGKRGVYATALNPQFDYDHKNDMGYYLDASYVKRRLEVLQDSFEKHKELARGMGGPAVIDVFGEPEFLPVNDEANYHYSDKQRALNVSYASQSGDITNRYIVGKERSFTIIAFPLPSIGDNFQEIFASVMEVNTLDYVKYQGIQQKLIDQLDLGTQVHVQGQNGNETDIYVKLFETGNPAKMTKFENCLADVNIPLGEVFTSPVLEGTHGLLHVSHVYLEGMEFFDLRLRFEDGMVTDYSCANFASEEENRRLIEENILYHHKSLPLGEFAIGTNTKAYRMARDYQIESKLPILIAEKTGPHFAVGDTCYSHEEDNHIYNPDGKEIVAKENSVSACRKERPQDAYLGCHTDITIPFEELGAIEVIAEDGAHVDLIRSGRFVLPGTEELNEPLEAM